MRARVNENEFLIRAVGLKVKLLVDARMYANMLFDGSVWSFTLFKELCVVVRFREIVCYSGWN